MAASKASSLLLKVALPLLLVAGLLAAWWFGPSRDTALVARVRSGIARNSVSGTLVVQAANAQDIKSEVSGRVTDMPMKLDKQVAAGEVLLQLDTGDLLLEIERCGSELAAARRKAEIGSAVLIELQNATDILAETQRQFSKGTVSETDVLRQKRAVQALEQRRDQDQLADKVVVETLENKLKVLNRQLGKMTLRAPFDGVVSRILTGRGDLISSGTPVARLIATDRIIEGRLSEENFAGVRVGQHAIVSFLPYGADQFDAKVAQVLSTSDPETQRYLVHLEVEAKQIARDNLIPGITGDLSIILAERPARTLIPRRALFGNAVYVVKDGRVVLRTVKTGFVSLTAVEVLEGLDEGELVIIADVDLFRKGQSVRTQLTADERWR